MLKPSTKALVVPALLLGLSTACVRGPGIRPIGPLETTFDAPFDDVWQSALTVFTDLNLPIANLERASGYIRTDEMTLDEGFGPYDLDEITDCGSEIGIARISSGATYLTVTVRVREASDRTVSATAQTAFVNYEEDAVGDDTVQCASTGAVEDLFLEGIADVLERGPG